MDNTVCKTIATAITRCRARNNEKGGRYVIVLLRERRFKGQDYAFKLHNVTFQGEPTEPVVFDGCSLNHKLARGIQ